MIEQLKSIFRRKAAEPVDPTEGKTLFNVYSTLLTLNKPEFPYHLQARRDLAHPDLLDHLGAFSGYLVARGDGLMSADKYHAILHLQRVQHQLSMWVAEADIPALYAWARKANAVMFTPDGNLIDPDGLVLVGAADGLAAPGASLPEQALALARRARTEGKLAALGIAVPAHLPPLVCEKELALRGEDEIAGRAQALLVCALRAESCMAGQPIAVKDLMAKLPKAALWLSPEEQAYLDLPEPTPHQSVQALWRYEAAYVMVWALGLVDALPYPDKACDPGLVVEAVTGKKKPALRDAGDILDALDLTYRLHWHIRQTRLKQEKEAEGVDASVVQERHHALNWLVRFQHAAWDQVDTPT